MTYRNKLLLKRALIVLGIAAVVVAVALLIGFLYLGRYVVYTENGAHFSFNAEAPTASIGASLSLPSHVEILTGESISAGEVNTGRVSSLPANEVKGIFVDYATLQSGDPLNDIELGDSGYNTLVLEMRASDQKLLTAEQVQSLIARAQNQDVWLVAMISCLADTSYANAHNDQALKVYGGSLWTDDDDHAWLDPGQDAVVQRITGMIQQLSQMGFQEVILSDFSFPVSDRIEYDYGDSSASDILLGAFHNLLDATMDLCDLSLLITSPENGHQAFDSADRIYVCYEDGATVKDYAEQHKDQYLVFLTSSHDTRFDSYGKVETAAPLAEDSDTDTTIDPSADVVTPVPQTDEEPEEYTEEEQYTEDDTDYDEE